jgi:hypothetical protein
MKIKHILLFLAASLFLFTCAQIGSLTGGDKDEDPPIFLKGTPEDKSVNFREDRITLLFDEFFVLNNLKSVFISSPFMEELPDFEINRKKLIIKLNEELMDSTTYHLWFGDAIEDYHENNPLKSFKYVFSTGPVLDTMEVSGKVINARDLTLVPDMHVILYKEYNDSTPILEKPYYITKSDTVGKFKIDYIKPGTYRIFALIDQDANYNFNLPNERIAFIDSLIIPEVETITRTDSLKAGTVLHMGETDEVGDTLLADTVIYTTEYIYSPSNLTLFSFIEDKEKQYVYDFSRDLKGKISFEFNRPVDDQVEVLGLNFNLDYERIFEEKDDSLRNIDLWIKDENLFNRDTLEFTVSYFNKDSANNLIRETDTLMFIYDIAGDSIETLVNFAELKEEQDSFSHFQIELETPIVSFDTSKIKLFELYDTLVPDKKEQKLLRSMRPAPEKLYFSINRPYVESFDIEFPDIEESVSYTRTYSVNDTILECIIEDETVYTQDTLKVVLSYDNKYFFNQIQSFSDTLIMPLFKQALTKIERPSSDTIIISFKKEVSEETNIIALNYEEESWYSVINQDDKEKVVLKINNTSVSSDDTLMLTIRTNDYDNTIGDKIDFEYAKPAIFKRKRQKINAYSRPDQNTLLFVLNIQPEDGFTVRLANDPNKKNWFTKSIANTKDSVFITITDPQILQKDTLQIIADYFVKLNKNVLTEKNDTLQFIYQKYKRKRRDDKKNNKDFVNESGDPLYEVSIEMPQKYTLLRDSVSERKLYMNYQWKPGIKYIFRADSGAFIDVFNNKSSQNEAEFSVRTKDYYGSFHLIIKNCKRISDKYFYGISDTSAYDSTLYSVLPEGQLILSLFSTDEKLIRQEFITHDDTVRFENLDPASFKLKLVYDKNLNGKWDTGDFLKNIQPERVLFYPMEITVNSNWLNEAEWIIKPPEN